MIVQAEAKSRVTTNADAAGGGAIRVGVTTSTADVTQAITKAQIGTLLKQEVIQVEHFSEQLCEIESDGIRYILRRNPVRAAEIEDRRQDQLQKLHRLITEKNTYLSEHPRAKVSVASASLHRWLEKLKLSAFCQIETEERTLSLTLDVDKKETTSMLDGCYVINPSSG